jgi:formamidopyrimidine-DNA glycosylase
LTDAPKVVNLGRGGKMPEGPEVARIVDQLRENAVDYSIQSVSVLGGRYLTHSLPDGLLSFLSDKSEHKIKDISCKGKFIWFTFEGEEWSIWNTLGMTGSWTGGPNTFSKVRFDIIKQGNKKTIHFNDIRNFGTLKFVNSKAELEEKIKSLGFDMLKSPPDITNFISLLNKNKNKTLPVFLMNQGHICGVGNYIKAESLYLSRLSPHRLCGSLTTEEADLLLKAITTVITSSYNSGGSTIKTYSDFYGNSGSFSNRFMVYGNKVDPQGNPVDTITTKDGRTTFWVPALQK